MTMTPAQRQALVYLATTVKAFGAPERPVEHVVAYVNQLAGQGISPREVIDQTLALVWGRDPIPTTPVAVLPVRDDPPPYDDATGERLPHRPLRELVDEARSEDTEAARAALRGDR